MYFFKAERPLQRFKGHMRLQLSLVHYYHLTVAISYTHVVND